MTGTLRLRLTGDQVLKMLSVSALKVAGTQLRWALENLS